MAEEAELAVVVLDSTSIAGRSLVVSGGGPDVRCLQGTTTDRHGIKSGVGGA